MIVLLTMLLLVVLLSMLLIVLAVLEVVRMELVAVAILIPGPLRQVQALEMREGVAEYAVKYGGYDWPGVADVSV